jgi:hypothetical protein
MATTTLPFKDQKDIEKVALGDFRKRHTKIARAELLDASRGDPSWKKKQVFTDNRFGKPDTAVKLFGKIEYAAEALDDVIAYIWTELNRMADRIELSGDYQKDLKMYVPGAGVFEGYKQIPPGTTEVNFYTVSPYGRKVENGLSLKAKGGIFKPTFRKAKSAFGKSARLTFSYTVPKDGKSVVRTNRKGGSLMAVPSPIIYLRQGGAFL